MTTNLTIQPSQHKEYVEYLVERRSVLKRELISIEAYLVECGRLKRRKLDKRVQEMAKQ